jgi:hypothetical protein
LRSPDGPDLVTRISISPDRRVFEAGEPVRITVEVINQGNRRADPFWVDLFINPASPPTVANLPWNEDCGMSPCFGIAWGVASGLGPGEHITLTSTPDSLAAPYSRWPGWFASGTTDLYVYADSWDPGVADGAVAETDETNNRAELHGLTVRGPNPPPPALVAPQSRPVRPATP